MKMAMNRPSTPRARTLAAGALLAALLAAAAPALAAQHGPRLTLSTRALTFARPGESATLVVGNDGDTLLSIPLLRVVHQKTGGSDYFVRPAAPYVVQPHGSLTLTVVYRPSQALGPAGQPRQSFEALELVTDDPSQPVDVRAKPEGNIVGVALRASLDPPLLSWIVFFPLAGIPLLLFVPAGRERATRFIALAVTLVPLLLAVRMAFAFDPTITRESGNFGLQFVEHLPWIRSLGAEYYVGVDGLSLVMILLTALVTVVAVGASFSIPLTQQPRGYFALLLLLEVGMMGVFASLDFLLFFVFWEVMLLPMYFLIGVWGGSRKEYAAIKFFLYTLLGSVLMLLALIALRQASAPTALVDGTPSLHTFDLMKLAHLNQFAGQPPILGFAFGHLIWVLLFIAFAIKIPVVPLHTWLPDAHVEAPTAISVILAGVLLKMGVYGLLRVSWAILPEATRWAAHAVAWMGVASILYGAFCAMAQKDLKRLVAYASVGHMGFCLLGIASLTTTGTSGAIVQLCSHGAITSMLFLLVGVLYDRTHARGLDEFGGVASLMPRYALLFGLAFMASLGLPGMSGFIAEALVFIGAFPVHSLLTLVAAGSLVITAAYHLGAIQKIQLGELNERWRAALAGKDLGARELATLVPLALIVLVLGFWPSPLLGAIAGYARDLVAAVSVPPPPAP
jgi:NADH-quinone oxidoreductase subunit M